MSLTAEQKKAVLTEYGVHETDTGSPEAQIALLTKRITDLTEHLTGRGADRPECGQEPHRVDGLPLVFGPPTQAGTRAKRGYGLVPILAARRRTTRAFRKSS